MAWIPYVYKANIDTGGAFIYSYDKPVMQDNLIAQSWKIDFPVKMLRDSDREGPSWKKWLDKEKTGAGPDIWNERNKTKQKPELLFAVKEINTYVLW